MAGYDEEAKAIKAVAELGSDAIEAVSKAGGFFTDILGDGPKDWVALKFSDRQKFNRAVAAVYDWENLLRIAHMVDERLIRDGVTNRKIISGKLGIEFLESASLEDDESIQKLYAELYATAVNPNAKNSVEIKHLQTLKLLSGADLVELKTIYAELIWAAAVGARQSSFSLTQAELNLEYIDRKPKTLIELQSLVRSGKTDVWGNPLKFPRDPCCIQSLLNAGIIERSLVDVNEDLNKHKQSLERSIDIPRSFGMRGYRSNTRTIRKMVRGSEERGGLTSYGFIFCEIVMPQIVQLKQGKS